MSPDTQAALGQLGFFLALLPTTWHKEHKPEFVSAILTAILCTWMVGVFARIDFLQSAAMTSLLAATWTLLAYQRFRINRANGAPSVPY